MSLRSHLRILRAAANYDIGRPAPFVQERIRALRVLTMSGDGSAPPDDQLFESKIEFTSSDGMPR